MKRFLLIFPPQWVCEYPHIALPSLSAQLKKNGYQSEVIDLNIHFYNDVLSKDYIENTLIKIKRMYEDFSLQYDWQNDETLTSKYRELENFVKNKLEKSKNLSFLVEKSIKTIKTLSEFKNVDRVFKAKKIIDYAMKVVFLPYFSQKNMMDDYFSSLDYLNLKDRILDKDKNIYFNFYSKYIEKIKEKKADFIGISISSKEQAVAGLTLAYFLKKQTKAHINIGGSFFSHNVETLKKTPEIFELFADSISLGEGEHSIVELAKFINNESLISDVSNLAYKENGVVNLTKKVNNVKLSEIAFPDYSDIDFSKYITPFGMLPLTVSRGCYWNKCSFCVLGHEKNYSEKSIDLFIKEIKFYKEKYNISFFNIVDQSVSPKYLNDLSDAIISHKLDVTFNIFLRLEDAFNKKLLKKMSKAGFRRIHWGLESINQKTLDSMNKGIKVENIKRILTDAKNVGIWNFVFFIIGFPTETFEETLKTIDFVFENKAIISEYCCTPFVLEKNSICLKDAQKYGIEEIKSGEDFSPIIPFVCKNTNSDLRNKLLNIIQEKEKQITINSYKKMLLYHYLLFYMKLYGIEFVKEIK